MDPLHREDSCLPDIAEDVVYYNGEAPMELAADVMARLVADKRDECEEALPVEEASP